MKIAILQPGFLPWLGFFEMMNKCDSFVFLDDVQYTKSDWRNRNRIKTKEGIQWLTVPVSFHFGQKIHEVRINNSVPWAKKHLQALRTWYGKSDFFHHYFEELEDILSKKWSFLSELDITLINWLIEKTGLHITLVSSSSLPTDQSDKQLRLVHICKALQCDVFYEGESGQNYIDPELFQSHGITVEFQEYHHPLYRQLWLKEQGFISHLSIIDLLFNHGAESLAIITGEKIVSIPEGTQVTKADKVNSPG